MREIFDKFVPIRGRFSADLSLLEGNNRQFCPSLRDFYMIDYSVLVCFFTPFTLSTGYNRGFFYCHLMSRHSMHKYTF